MKQDIREEYLDTLTSQIRYKKARMAVRREIDQHLEDQIGEYLMAGMEQEEAEREAVRQMGDPVEVGISMDRIHRPQMPWVMIGWIGILSLVGFGVQAALQTRFPDLSILPRGMVSRLLFLTVGLGAMTGVCFLDYSRIGRYSKEITIALWICLYGGTWIFGREINGSMRWIYTPAGVSVYMGLTAWLFVPLYGGILYRYRGRGYGGLVKALLWMAPTLWLLLSSPDISNLAVVFLACSGILSVAVWKGWFQVRKKAVLAVWWGGVLLTPAVLILAALGSDSYRGERVRALLGISGEGPGYQVEMTRRLLSGVRLLGGAKAGEISQTSLADPGGRVLTYGIACYGILAAAVLVAAIVFLVLRFLKISLHQKNQLGMLMGAGCCAVFFWDLLFYLCNNTGLLGLEFNAICPFLTYGGTGTIVTYLLLGLLLSICRYQKVADGQEWEQTKTCRLSRTAQ